MTNPEALAIINRIRCSFPFYYLGTEKQCAGMRKLHAVAVYLATGRLMTRTERWVAF